MAAWNLFDWPETRLSRWMNKTAQIEFQCCKQTGEVAGNKSKIVNCKLIEAQLSGHYVVRQFDSLDFFVMFVPISFFLQFIRWSAKLKEVPTINSHIKCDWLTLRLNCRVSCPTHTLSLSLFREITWTSVANGVVFSFFLLFIFFACLHSNCWI